MQFFIVGFLICFDIALVVFAIAGELKRSATAETTRTGDLIRHSTIVGVFGGVVFFAAGSAIWALLGADVMPPDWRWLIICLSVGALAGFIISLARQGFLTLDPGSFADPVESIKLIFWSTVLAGLYLGTVAYVSTPIWSWML